MTTRPGSIERLRALWSSETSPAARRVCGAVLAACLVAAALIGRLGHDWSRAAALALAVLGVVPTIAHLLVGRRQRRDPKAVMAATLLRTEPDLARAALRALDLQARTGSGPELGSHELAQLHLARLLGRASLDRLMAKAGRSAWLAALLAASLAVGTVAAVATDPFRVLEGLNVLAARDGVAPLEVEWVELPHVAAEPPSYLGLSRSPLRPFFPVALPSGTTLTISAVPLRSGRRLVLTDGAEEVVFHEDGDGAVVARWTVEQDASLRIGARFGDTLVLEPLALDVHAIADYAPHIRLEGAPASFVLLDHPRVPIHWEASDDHGLREVVLKLRAGEREERRPLSTHQGGSLVDRGGIELFADDPFLEKSYLPVEVTVEALDNDPIGGPKWGRSESLLLVPPQIGEREALRYAALSAARDELTDLLAARLLDSHESERGGWLEREQQAQRVALERLRQALDADFGGLRIRGRFAALARGQMEKLDEALAKARRQPTIEARSALRDRTEASLLALDSALGALGARDTQSAALQLADVAADAAAAIELGRDPRERDRARRRLDADLQVLDGGGGHLVELGRLGIDLGEIVANGLRRIRRAMRAGDRYHAKLAAEDLAARLRQPLPSFGSAGGGHGHGGVESGGTPGQSDGEPSQAAEQAAGLEQALEQLRQEHAQQIAEVDKALREATSPEDREAQQEKLRELAKEMREAVADLPRQAADPDSARSAAARGRSQAESAATSLERGDLDQAAQQGEKALQSLRDAARKGGQAPDGSSEQEAGRAAGDAAQRLRGQLDQAEQALDDRRRTASERARSELEQAAERERELAQRARELRAESASSEAPMPGEMLERLREAAESMDQASRQLEQSKGSEGLDKQREAQRLLEMAQPESEPESDSGNRDGDGRDFARDAEVPGQARDARADDFRNRVTQGLGRDVPPHLREALRRYTEGLLR